MWILLNPHSLEQIGQKLSRNSTHLKQQCHITQLGIFGSYIRGETIENSDLDILVGRI